MILNKQRSLVHILSAFFVLICLLNPVEAGIFKTIIKAGQEAGEAGSKLGRKLDVLPGLSKLPDEVGVAKVRLDVDADGSVLFYAEGGQTWAVKQGDDVSSVLKEIQKSQSVFKSGNVQKLKFYLSADQLFSSGNNNLLKNIDDLHLFDNGKAFPLKKMKGANSAWQVIVRDNLRLNVSTRQALEEGLWQLNKSINRANMRLVSFVPNMDGLPSRVQATAYGDAPELTMINPAYLENSLNVLRHQTLIVTGKRTEDFLEIKGNKGQTNSIDLDELQSIALKHDVNLIVLESPTPAQLGSRILPWNKVTRHTDIEKAFSSETYGEFLTTLSGRNMTMTFEFERKKGNFVSFQSNVEDIKMSSSNIDYAEESFIGIESFAHIIFHASKIVSHTKEYDKEQEQRIFPEIPSWVHITYFCNILAGLMVPVLVIPFWIRIWPKKVRDDYNSWVEYTFFRLVRLSFYLFIFLGFFGLVVIIGRCLIIIYQFIMILIKMILWPFRMISRVLSKV